MKLTYKSIGALSFVLLASASHANIFESMATQALGKAAAKYEEYKASKESKASTPMGASNAPGFTQCPGFFPYGTKPALPASATNWKLRELCFDAFAVLHSGLTRTPIFSVEKLNRAQLGDAKGEVRTDIFYADARLPRDERAELKDYTAKGAVNESYDRGHMSPAADQPTPAAMAQSFSLANMIPQAPQNNRKAWASIEKATRQYVGRAQGDVYVFTGPAFVENAGTLNGRLKIPSHVYKLVYDQAAHRAWAYWLPNTNEARVTAPISYQEFTQKIGFEFLPGVNPNR